MSRINQKLGLKPTGKRWFMHLPDSREAAARLTRAQCPQCQRRGVTEFTAHKQRTWFCTWCNHTWAPPA